MPCSPREMAEKVGELLEKKLISLFLVEQMLQKNEMVYLLFLITVFFVLTWKKRVNILRIT
jgi:hypothetical protein